MNEQRSAPEPSRQSRLAPDCDLDARFFFREYNAMSRADTDRQDGIDTFPDTDIVFRSLSWEQLVYLLRQEGNYLILLGGPWCHNTRAAIGCINDCAHAYGVETIYNFDLRLDGATPDTHIRVSNGDASAAAPYNHLYGELASRFLTNLTDWVEYTEDSESALTYMNSDGVDITAAKVQVPFLFLYNKDNAVDNSGKGRPADRFPIVFGFEEMVDRDSKGIYVLAKDAEGNPVQDADGNNVRSYITDAYLERLRGVFDYIQDHGVVLSDWSDGDCLRQAFRERAQGLAGQELFAPGRKIAYNVIPYAQLDWLLRQEGNFRILLGGPWCGQDSDMLALLNTINDCALAGEQTIWMADLKLDGGFARQVWGYGEDLEICSGDSPLVRLYANLLRKYLTNIRSPSKGDADEDLLTISYEDETGSEVRVRRLRLPCLLAYNRDAVDPNGSAAPVVAYFEWMGNRKRIGDDQTDSRDVSRRVKAVLEASAAVPGDQGTDVDAAHTSVETDFG